MLISFPEVQTALLNLRGRRLKNQYGAKKKCKEREGGRHAMVKVPPSRVSLSRVSRAPYIFHAPASLAELSFRSEFSVSTCFILRPVRRLWKTLVSAMICE